MDKKPKGTEWTPEMEERARTFYDGAKVYKLKPRTYARLGERKEEKPNNGARNATKI